MSRVLVVEDDPEIRELVTTYLMQADFEVMTAIDGIEALRVVRSVQPDVILMDMGLPKLNGWQTTQRLRSRHDTANIPIIALTAYVLENERKWAIDIGCNAFEAKPINFESLLNKIRTLIASPLAR
ncbi:MAG: response regulator [Chloroflexaceae bacterium]|nr:response regulator [Chloroflexaceae bacterium]